MLLLLLFDWAQLSANKETGLIIAAVDLMLLLLLPKLSPGWSYKQALRYRDGEGVEKNTEKAANLIRSAAERGYAKAQNTLGKELLEAARLIKSAADQQGYDKISGVLADSVRYIKETDKKQPPVKVSNALGIMLLQGASFANADDIDKRKEEAFIWLEKAAKQGLPDAQNNLGVMYDNGEGMKQGNKEEAVKLYKQAAEQGYAGAQFNLGLMYRDGEGGSKKNQQEAYTWFLLAARSGHEQILKAKEDLAGKLESNEVRIAAEEEAKKLAEEIDNRNKSK